MGATRHGGSFQKKYDVKVRVSVPHISAPSNLREGGTLLLHLDVNPNTIC
jgi:hypothetical protein